MEQRQRYLDEALNPDIALRRTAYDDQGKLPCDGDTRVEILADITNWVNDVSAKSQNFFWLTGDPGCGKSAIAASVARYCKDEGILWAQFFINRNNDATTNPRVYFPSIARQMARHSSNSTVSKTIYDALQVKPSLLDQMSNDQALKLFVQVVQVACDIKKSKPVVIVIDGLDETSRKSLEDTAEILSGLFKKLMRPNAKVFISSRTDNEIRKPFFCSLQANDKHVKHVHLNTSDASSMEDVSKYLSRKIGKLAMDQDLNLEIWPGQEPFQTLCLRAAGLFIWAVTVVKFFEEQLRLYGHECLNDLLHEVNAEGMEDVNRLYQTILRLIYSSNRKSSRTAWAYETFRWVMGFIIGLKEPLSIGDIDALLDLRRTSTSGPIDILHFVTNLRTVLVAGTGEITTGTIPQLHKSFVEFITSDEADEEFRIDVDIVDMEIVMKCLALVSRPRNDNACSRILSASVHYAIHNWMRHLHNGGSTSGVVIVGDDEAFLKCCASSTALRTSFMSVSGDYRTHMYDPQQGFPPPAPPHFSHHSTIEIGDSVEAITISMDGQLIASGTAAGDIRLRDGQLIAGPLENLSGRVYSLCFSPDSRWLVSGSDNGSIGVWDCQTGEVVGSPLSQHTSTVNSVCTDGHFIISGSSDKVICIWDIKVCKQIGLPINAGKTVHAVALSNDGCIAAGVDKTVCVWNLKTHDHIASMTGHISNVYTVAFSPDNSRIASGSQDKTIRLWDTQTYMQICKFTGHRDRIWSVSFSSNGKWLASGSHDKTICIWNSHTGQLMDSLEGHTSPVTFVAFSLKGNQLISGSWDDTVCTWSQSHQKKEWPKLSTQISTIHFLQHTCSTAASLSHMISLKGNPSVVSACYSLDRTLYAASTSNGHVFLWHIEHGLLWKSNALIHPIHLLRLFADQLIISSPDGSVWTWDMVDGKPTNQTPTTFGPQLNQKSGNSSLASVSDKPIIKWIPFKIDAGIWAYFDRKIIRFESVGGGSVTVIDIGDIAQ